MISYRGVVQKNQGRASALGYPTANIPLGRKSAASGVYAARVRAGNRAYEAAAFADPERGILEAHLLDFSGDLYGERITVELLSKIRDTARFGDDERLRAAIARDIAKVRRYFKN